jgi:hypothetical protein
MTTVSRIAFAALAIALNGPMAAVAQDPGGAARARPSPSIAAGKLGAMSSPQRFLVTSSANDRGAFLWVIDAVEHDVTLCEKPAGASEFTCSKKALP